MFKKNFLFPFFLLIGIFSAFLKVNAGIVSVISKKDNYFVNEKFQLDFVFDTKGKKINTIGGKIFLPKKYFKIVGVSQEGSIISHWITPPTLFQEGDDFGVSFSGLIIGGYSGSDAIILSLILEGQKEGIGKIRMDELKTLLNDGKGTEINSVFLEKDVVFSDSQENKNDHEELKKDTTAPLDFDLVVSKSEFVFSNQWFVTFDAKDDQSGINYFLVQENQFSVPDEKKWKKIEKGPYLLEDQSLKSFIFVKAVDNAGNEKMKFLAPLFDKNGYFSTIEKGIVFLVVFCLFFFYFIKRKKNV